MSKSYKINRKAFTAWNYQNEIDEMNKMSEQGWQLVQGRLFSQKYVKDDSVVYKHQLDYQPKIENMGRYIETFREQGWEYVNSTFNGWHYFRKVYDPSLPAEEYEIYSDKTSLDEMNNRFIRLGTFFIILLALDVILLGYKLYLNFALSRAFVTFAMFIEFVWILTGVIKMKNNKKTKKPFNARYFLAFLFGSFLVYFLVHSARIHFNTRTQAEYYSQVTKTNPVNFYESKVVYPDFYTLDIAGKIETPLTLVIENTESGDIMLETTLVPDSQKNVKYSSGAKFYKKGSYAIKYTNFAGGMMDLDFDWD